MERPEGSSRDACPTLQGLGRPVSRLAGGRGPRGRRTRPGPPAGRSGRPRAARPRSRVRPPSRASR
ncbi:MAG: hypothetical protein E6I40_04165 [Chloroflexi bacterium]|nr:MAG: hypothetical protein E6I40_04165 [Chloroflexota bacterium]TMF60346.1 MAG: hypothetical protein E6I20_14345 [Chloroflexota bacterium]TMG35612.1 MAG: hypothetical protein E6H88_12050 [Chloroflexota bacterium]